MASVARFQVTDRKRVGTAVANDTNDPDAIMVDHLLASVKAILRARGISEDNSENLESLIQVHCHPFREIHRSANDVAVCPYDKGIKLVILLRPTSFRTINRSAPDWSASDDESFRVLCLDPVPGIFDALEQMLIWVNEELGKGKY